MPVIDGTAFTLRILHDLEPAIAVRVRASACSPKALRLALAAALRQGDSHRDLVLEALRRTVVAWSPATYRVMPVLRPYVTRDGAARGPGLADQWGTPDSRGLFRDDNSMLKSLPASLAIVDRDGRPLGRRGRGWTACHAWRAIPSTAKASADPWLNSFIPVLTWVPTVLAPYTDVEGGRAQALLKGMGESFRHLPVHAEVADVAEAAWRKLPAVELVEPSLRFQHSALFVRRRLASLRRVSEGVAKVARGEPPGHKILANRYTSGLPTVDIRVLRELTFVLDGYADGVDAASAAG